MKLESFLVNPGDRDPTLYVSRTGRRGTFMFDCGENWTLEPRLLRKVTHLFVTHCHIDHFIGFDMLLRLKLYEDRTFEVFGPAGITGHIEGKLGGYTWNLTPELCLRLRVHEIEKGMVRISRFDSRQGFKRYEEGVFPCPDNLLSEGDGGSVTFAELDHSIPTLGYAFQSEDLLHVREERLRELGLEPGQWIRDLMVAYKRGERGDKVELDGREYESGRLQDELLVPVPGVKIAYVVDVLYSEENARRIVELARGARKFYCEATFVDEDYQRAADRFHLTARQAGMLAREAGVTELHLCHFSKRYNGCFDKLYEEAKREFPNVF